MRESPLKKAQRLARQAMRSRRCDDVRRYADRAARVAYAEIGTSYLEQPFTRLEAETLDVVRKAKKLAKQCARRKR